LTEVVLDEVSHLVEKDLGEEKEGFDFKMKQNAQLSLLLEMSNLIRRQLPLPRELLNLLAPPRDGIKVASAQILESGEDNVDERRVSAYLSQREGEAIVIVADVELSLSRDELLKSAVEKAGCHSLTSEVRRSFGG
jgi:hypothetical protein